MEGLQLPTHVLIINFPPLALLPRDGLPPARQILGSHSWGGRAQAGQGEEGMGEIFTSARKIACGMKGSRLCEGEQVGGARRAKNDPAAQEHRGPCGCPALGRGTAKADPNMGTLSHEKCSAFLITQHVPEMGQNVIGFLDIPLLSGTGKYHTIGNGHTCHAQAAGSCRHVAFI